MTITTSGRGKPGAVVAPRVSKHTRFARQLGIDLSDFYDDQDYTPVTIGKVWERDPETGLFVLPEYTLGWAFLEWTEKWLNDEDRNPFVLTHEQARFALWFFAVDKEGDWLWENYSLERIKGWGKSPLGAAIALFTAFGPSHFTHIDEDGFVVSTEPTEAWVQVAAVKMEQTENIFRACDSLTKVHAKALGLVCGTWQVTKKGNKSCGIYAIATTSTGSQEGGRPILVLCEEIHHWTLTVGGFVFWEVISRNAAKKGRTLSVTNAVDPNVDSVGARQIQRWRDQDEAVYYDSLQAPAYAKIETKEQCRQWLLILRGDSKFFQMKSTIRIMMDKSRSLAEIKRFYLNQAISSEDRWVDIADFLLGETDAILGRNDEIVLFLDCSLSDDGTALVARRLRDGVFFVMGYWEPTQQHRRARGEAPIVDSDVVDAAVRKIFDTYKVIKFAADPSHAKDRETRLAYWDGVIDGWHKSYKTRLPHWATGTKSTGNGHSIRWDMSDFSRQQEFCAAAGRMEALIFDRECKWARKEMGDLRDDNRLVTHVKNAKRYETRAGFSIWKGSRESVHKVDLAVAMTGAYKLSIDVENKKKTRRIGVGAV